MALEVGTGADPMTRAGDVQFGRHVGHLENGLVVSNEGKRASRVTRLKTPAGPGIYHSKRQGTGSNWEPVPGLQDPGRSLKGWALSRL